VLCVLVEALSVGEPLLGGSKEPGECEYATRVKG
jgi:hypothetical protein